MDIQPVTRTEFLEGLGATKSELLEALAATKSELLDALAANKADIIEAVRDAQTEVVKAFFSYQGAQSVKFQYLDAEAGNTTVAMRKCMDILEQRLAGIEKKTLPMPPLA